MGQQQVAVKWEMLLWKKAAARGFENQEGSDVTKQGCPLVFPNEHPEHSTCSFLVLHQKRKASLKTYGASSFQQRGF